MRNKNKLFRGLITIFMLSIVAFFVFGLFGPKIKTYAKTYDSGEVTLSSLNVGDSIQKGASITGPDAEWLVLIDTDNQYDSSVKTIDPTVDYYPDSFDADRNYTVVMKYTDTSPNKLYLTKHVGVEKTLAVGTEWYFGDIFVISGGSKYLTVSTPSSYAPKVSVSVGKYVVPRYSTATSGWYFLLDMFGSQDFGVPDNRSDKTVPEGGFRCSGGSGTDTDPYTFEVIDRPDFSNEILQVGSNFYTTMEEAVAACPADGTVKLLADIDLTGAGLIVPNGNITIDLNGHTLSKTGTNEDGFTVGGINLTLLSSATEPGKFNCYIYFGSGSWRVTHGNVYITDTFQGYQELVGYNIYKLVEDNKAYEVDENDPMYDLGYRTRIGEAQLEGDGSESDPYKITSKKDMENFRDIVNGLNGKEKNNSANAVLMNDINLNGNNDNQWNPILGYRGTFDGQGHTISGLYINKTTTDYGVYVALFGTVTGSACIKNLTVNGSVTLNFSSYSSRDVGAAGLVAKLSQDAFSGTVIIENCTNNATVNSTDKGDAAGILAWGSKAYRIKNCVNTAAVRGDMAGGILAETAATPGEIIYCHNTGTITGKSIGGVAGDFRGTITHCYNTGNVTGWNEVAGLVGSADNITMTNCYNTGDIDGSTGSYGKNGGIVGSSSGTNTISNCFNYGNITGTLKTGSLVGTANVTISNCYALTGTHTNLFGEDGLTNDGSKFISADEFKLDNSFVNWDFEEVWEMSSKHPVLLPYAPYAALDTTTKPNILVPNNKEKAEEGDVISVDTTANPISVKWYYDDDKDGLPDEPENPIDTNNKHKIKFPEDSGHVIIGIVEQTKKSDGTEYPKDEIPTVTTNPVQVSGEIIHIHKITYKASGDTITATCSAKDCPTPTTTLKLLPPSSLTLENKGDTLVASFQQGYDEDIFNNPVIYYYLDGKYVQQIDTKGHYMAKVIFGDAIAMIEFDVDALFHEHDDILFNAWTSTNSLPSEPGNYYLANDVTVSGTWNVPTGTTNLCLNGHGIKKTGSGSMMSISSGATLKIYDCGDTEHYFDYPSGAKYATNINDTPGANRVSFSGGYITSTADASAILVNGGTLELHNGNIIGNHYTPSGNKGAAIRVYDSGTFKMYGGSISYNYAQNTGAGVHVSNATMYMYDGLISHNYTDWAGGSAIAAHRGGTVDTYLYLYGGVIENNYTKNTYGAIDVNTGDMDHIVIHGSPVVRNNWNVDSSDTTERNISIRADQSTPAIIEFDGTLGADASFGVRLHYSNGFGQFTSGWSTYMGAENSSRYICSEDSNLYISLMNGEVAVVPDKQIVQVGGNTYSSLQIAYEECSPDGIIKLLEDIDLSQKYIDINIAKNIVIDLNGKILKFGENQIVLSGTSVLTIDNSKIQTGGVNGIIPKPATTAKVVFSNARTNYTKEEIATSSYLELADGFAASNINEDGSEDANGFKTIIRSSIQIAEINGVIYSDFQNAYKDWEEGDVIKLLADLDLSNKGKPWFTISRNIVIDLNGYIIKSNLGAIYINENNCVEIINSVATAGGFNGGIIPTQNSVNSENVYFIFGAGVRLPMAAEDINMTTMNIFRLPEGYVAKNINSDKSPDENGFVSIIAKSYTPLDPDGTPTVNKPDHTPLYVGEEITVSTDATPVVIKWYYVDENGNPTGDPIGEETTYTIKKPNDLGKKIVAVITQNEDEKGDPYEEGKEPTQTTDVFEVYKPIDDEEEVEINTTRTNPINGDEISVTPSFTPSTVKWYYDDDEDGKPDSTTPIGEGNKYKVVCPDPNDETHDDTGHTIIAVISQDVDENGNPITTEIPTITTKGVKIYTPLNTTTKTSINTPNHDPLLEGDEISVDSDASEVTFEWFYTDEDGNPTGEPIGTEKTYTIKNPNDLGKKIIAVITQNKKPDGTDYADAEKPKQYSNVVTVYKPLDTDPLNKPDVEGLGEKPKAENGDELEVKVDYNPVEIKWYYDDNNDGQPDDPTKPLGTGTKYKVKSPDPSDENHDDKGHTIIAVITQPTKPNGDPYEEGKAPTQSSKPVVVKGVIGGFVPLTPEQEITEETPDHTPLYVGDEITVDVSSNPIKVEWFYTDEEGNPTGNPIGEGTKYTVKPDDLGKKIIPVITQNKNEDGDDLPEENWVNVNGDPIEIYKAFDEETDVTTSSPARMPLEVGDEIEVTVDANPVTIKWYYDDNEDGIPDNLDNPLGEGNKYTVKEEDKEHAIVAVVTQDKKPDGTDYADDEKPRRNNSLIAIDGYEHVHNFTYEDFDNQIMAKCTELCNITEGLVLTLKAPSDLGYDGKAKVITFEEGYSRVAFDNIVVKYYKNDAEVEAAIELGAYVAKVTFGDATAEIEFVIVKGTPVVNLPKGLTLEVGQKLKDVTLPSGFAWENSEQVVNSTGTQKFTATFTPTDEDHYNDVTVEIEVTPTWNIEPTDVENVEVEIKNPDGVALDDKVSVKVEVKTNVKATAEKKTYNNIEKDYVENGKEITFVYSVKLVRTVVKDGVEVQEEIQPSDIKEGTVIVVTMNVPEALKGQAFRVLHIHNNQDINYVDYKLSEDGNTITVEVNRLSEFAFVSTKADHGFCVGYVVLIFAIIAVIWLIVYVLAYYGLVDKLADLFEAKLDLIGLISLCAAAAIFLFALIALILHVCPVTIVSFILTFIVCAIFLVLFLLKKFKKNKKSIKAQRKANAKKEIKEEVKEEALVEEPQEESLEPEETKDEPQEEVKEEQEVKEEASNENSDDEEEFEDEEENAVVSDNQGHFFKLMYNKSFTAKLIQTDDDIKNYYQELKNYILSYKGTVSRMSWGNDSINKGRNNLLKFSFKRKNLYLYLALNADEYADSKYRLTKVETKKYQSVPSLYAVRNDRNLQYAKELIDIICQKLELEKGDAKADNYVLPYEDTKALLEKGLIKEVKKALSDKKEIKVKTRKEVSESEVNSLMSNETANFLIVDERKGPRSGKKGIVNIADLERCFNDGDTVNVEALKEKKLIPSNIMQVKLLSHGKLDKKLNVELQDFSIEAAKMIILTGGTVKRV